MDGKKGRGNQGGKRKRPRTGGNMIAIQKRKSQNNNKKEV